MNNSGQSGNNSGWNGSVNIRWIGVNDRWRTIILLYAVVHKEIWSVRCSISFSVIVL